MKTVLSFRDIIWVGPLPEGVVPVTTFRPQDPSRPELHLLVHPAKIPKSLLEKHYTDLLYLFRPLFVSVRLEEDAEIALCQMTRCHRKVEDGENRECPYFCYGVCTAATQKISDHRKSYTFIAGLLGRTKQTHQQAGERHYRSLREAIQSEPFLLEFLTS